MDEEWAKALTKETERFENNANNAFVNLNSSHSDIYYMLYGILYSIIYKSRLIHLL